MKEFLEKKKEIIEKIKQGREQKKGEAEQSYFIVSKSVEVGMRIMETTLNGVKDILDEINKIPKHVQNKLGGNSKMDGVKGNEETAEVAFIGGIKDAIDEMNNAGKKWIDEMKEKVDKGTKKFGELLEDIKTKKDEVLNILGKLTGDAQKKFEELLDSVEETQNQIIKKLDKASKEGKKHLTDMLEEVKEIQDEIADKMKEVAESTDKKITDAANEAINNAEKRLEDIRKKLKEH